MRWANCHSPHLTWMDQLSSQPENIATVFNSDALLKLQIPTIVAGLEAFVIVTETRIVLVVDTGSTVLSRKTKELRKSVQVPGLWNIRYRNSRQRRELLLKSHSCLWDLSPEAFGRVQHLDWLPDDCSAFVAAGDESVY